MSRIRSLRALTGTAVLCVFAFFLAQCAADVPEDSCDAGCVAGEACQDGGCVDEACIGVACPEGQTCSNGGCVQSVEVPDRPVKAQWGQKVENGETCATDLDCYSGACADGVCCDSACEGRCEACNMVGSEGVCSVVSQGTFCDDGDACTLADVCDGTGPDSCGGAPKACDSPPDQCHVAVGTCAQGACSYAPKPVGTMCDDGNACTRGETCGADTACGSGTMKTCDTPPGVCLENAGACLPATGECAYVPRQQGAACRAATGPCDVVEVCTGANGECPPDAKQPAGSACTDDGNPCTTDVCDASGTCLHPTMEAGTSCGAEGVCTGAAQCAQGCWIDGELHASGTTNPAGACQVCDPTQSKTAWSFKPATTQCRGASGVCDAAEYCTGSSAQCPGDGAVANGTTCGSSSEGSWGACGGFSGTCGESGTESRTVTAQACFNGACQPSSTTESRTCGRSTEGNTCGSSSSGNWSSCSYSGTCGEEGSRSRTVSGGVCSAGTCHQSSYTETEDCYRSTEGKACGTNSTEAWGSCSFYGGVCGETGARGRTVHRGICSSGSCNQSTYRETEGCSRSTTGIRCGDTNYYPWDICRNESNDCATTGTMTRSVTERLCEWGMCRDVSYYQSAGCTRNPAGRTCDDGNACTTGDVCTGGGGCSGTSMSCPAGQSCSGGVCSGGSGCSAGQQRCNGSCTDLLFDSYNCGGCGIQCNPNQNEVCSYGSCQCQQTPGSPYQCP